MRVHSQCFAQLHKIALIQGWEEKLVSTYGFTEISLYFWSGLTQFYVPFRSLVFSEKGGSNSDENTTLKL